MPDLSRRDAASAPLRDHAFRAWSTARRTVLRRRRLLSALCAAGAVLATLRAVAPPPPDTVTVLTAARDLPSGVVLAEDDLEPVEFAKGTAPAGRPTRDDAVGRTLASPMRQGEAVTDTRLVQASLLAGYPGLVAVPVRIPDAGAVALLEVGDRVDVLVADPGGGSDAEVAVSEAPVISLPGSPAAGASGVSAAAQQGALVVLAVAPTDARKLAADAVRAYLSVAISG
jgi:Flp pilus assembly protein CpaB